MVSGRKTYSEIERSISDLRDREQQLLKDVEGINAHHMRLLEQRTAAFRELAEVRARSAVADGVIDRADELQVRVESLLKARQTTITQLKNREAAAQSRRDNLSASADGLRTEIAALEGDLDTAAAQARDQLSAEPDYKALRQTLEDSRQTYEKAAEKTDQAELDRQTKGAAYESDPLFMYLWDRNYGAEQYRPGALIRMADDWVARLIGYHEARANYAILNEIPVRLAEHVSDLAGELEAAENAVEAVEASRINEIAGEDLIGRLSDARDRQQEANDALEAVDAEIAEISRQLLHYTEGLDPAFQEAVKVSASFLEQESYQQLIVLARKTDGPEDDRIVERIGETDRRIADLERTIGERRKDLDRVARKRSELLEVAQKYRRNYYEDIGSEFELDDIAEDVLEALIKGAITGADYWARSQRRQRWRGRPADSFRKSIGFPPFGGGWGRGSSGGRRRGGGGFRTGGGF